MAINTAIGNLSFKILPDEIRKRFNGTLSYTGRDATEKWIYKKAQITHAATALFTTDDEFLAITTSTDLVLTDNVQFIIIKHTGFTDTNQNVTTDIGVLINYGGADITPDRGDDDANTSMFLAAGDTMALKVPASEAADWRAITVKVTNGVPSDDGASGDNVLLEIAAIVDDGG
jgi:hypothetical protein